MGQYHPIVNLDRREFIDPHQLDVGLKAWEQLAAFPGTPQALLTGKFTYHLVDTRN